MLVKNRYLWTQSEQKVAYAIDDQEHTRLTLQTSQPEERRKYFNFRIVQRRLRHLGAFRIIEEFVARFIFVP